jgi:hypothetical protein
MGCAGTGRREPLFARSARDQLTPAVARAEARPRRHQLLVRFQPVTSMHPGERSPALTPAPWKLRGRAWIAAVRLPRGSASRHAFLPPGLPPGSSHLSFFIFVDYVESDCGPYQELLFVPGTFRFSNGQEHLTVSRILVSTSESAVNGRRNWGLPKDRAEFKIDYRADGGRTDRIVVSHGPRTIADVRLRAWPLFLPVTTRVVPRAIRTFAQRFERRDYFFAPSAKGWLSPGKLLSWKFDADLFPDLAGAKVLAAAKVVSLNMTVPKAETRPADP